MSEKVAQPLKQTKDLVIRLPRKTHALLKEYARLNDRPLTRTIIRLALTHPDFMHFSQMTSAEHSA